MSSDLSGWLAEAEGSLPDPPYDLQVSRWDEGPQKPPRNGHGLFFTAHGLWWVASGAEPRRLRAWDPTLHADLQIERESRGVVVRCFLNLEIHSGPNPVVACFSEVNLDRNEQSKFDRWCERVRAFLAASGIATRESSSDL